MKKWGSILLINLYVFSMMQMMVPVVSFYMNHEYIKTHHCLSLTIPDYSIDCDGFCYLKKQIEGHHSHDHDGMDHHNSQAIAPKVPFVYLLDLFSKQNFSRFSDSESEFIVQNELLPSNVYIDLTTPPPRS